MEVILIFVAGFIVFIIAIFSVIRMATNRITTPTENLKEEVTNLKNRIDKLENDKKKADIFFRNRAQLSNKNCARFEYKGHFPKI